MDTPPGQKNVSLSVKAGVATISLSRPPVNAYNAAMLSDLLAVITQVESDNDIRAVVLASAIDGFFSAGADVFEFASNTRAENTAIVDMARSVTAAISGSEKPYIAAIAGHALGGGLELALSCDMRLGADRSYKVGLPEVKLGLIPGNGGVQRLVRVVGASRALELCVMGETISPSEAESWGVFNHLFAADDFKQGVDRIASTLAISAPLAVKAAKRCIAEGVSEKISEALLLEKSLGDPLYESNDAAEGLAAFAERRSPLFSGS